MGHITGIGGVFFKARNPKALATWYRDVLGMPVQSWGGAALHYDAQNHPTAAAWSPFAASSNFFAPSTAPFMVNYTVDNLDAIVVRLRAKGVEILKRDDSDDNGRFVWVVDPEGNKVELWEPKRVAPAAPRPGREGRRTLCANKGVEFQRIGHPGTTGPAAVPSCACLMLRFRSPQPVLRRTC